MITLSDFSNKIMHGNQLIPANELALRDIEWLDFYRQYDLSIDREVYRRWGDLYVRDGIEYEYEGNVHELIEDFLILNQKKYEKLYAIEALDYDPIHNYDGVETTIDEWGKKVVTDEKGQMVSKLNSAAKTITSNDYVNGFNEGTATPTGKSETITPAYEDSTTVNAHTDTNTSETYTDTHTVTKGGNLGVTTTQQMMSQEEDYWSRFNATMIMMRDIVYELTNGLYASVNPIDI